MEYKNNKTANRRRYKSRYHSPHNYKAKHPSSGKRAPILIGIATFLVLASLVLVFTFGDRIYAFLDNTFHPAAIIPSEAETLGFEFATTDPTDPPEPETEAPAETPTETPLDQEAEFNRLVAAANLDLTGRSTTQLIFFESAGTSAKVHFYEKEADGKWSPRFMVVDGFVGAGGVADVVGPADNTSPKGNFGIEYAMGTNMDPGTAMPYTTIYYGLRWVTDPASANYNRLVDTETPVDYTDFQDLYEYTVSYPYALVLDYNRNPVNPSLGCAKFMHVASGPTYGGVGISERALQTILLWLKPEASPMVCIF